MMIVAMNSEILTRFHRTCVVPLRFWFQTHKDEIVGCLLLVGCCCSRNHQVDSCEPTCSIKRSHEQQQRYSTRLRRHTHTTVMLTYYSRLSSTRFCVINQVLVGMSGPQHNGIQKCLAPKSLVLMQPSANIITGGPARSSVISQTKATRVARTGSQIPLW